MKRIITIQVQLILGLVVGTIFSFILVRAFPMGYPGMLTPTPLIPSSTAFMVETIMPSTTPVTPMMTNTPAPFSTISGVWMLRVKFFVAQAPEVVKATFLQSGRITPFDQGDYTVEILDPQGNVLFAGHFSIVFLQGDPPSAVEELTTFLVIPAVEEAASVRLNTPQGETTYEFEP